VQQKHSYIYINSSHEYLIFIEVFIGKLVLSLFLKRYDDQGNEDIDEEKWEHDEVHDVEKSHLYPVSRLRTVIFDSGVDGMFQNPT